jgi:hypothetical protein
VFAAIDGELAEGDAHNFSDAGKWCVVSVASPPVDSSQQRLVLRKSTQVLAPEIHYGVAR